MFRLFLLLLYFFFYVFSAILLNKEDPNALVPGTSHRSRWIVLCVLCINTYLFTYLYE